MDEAMKIENLENAKEFGAFKEIYCETIHMLHNGSQIIISVAEDKDLPFISIAKDDIKFRVFIQGDRICLAAGNRQDVKCILTLDGNEGTVELANHNNEIELLS